LKDLPLLHFLTDHGAFGSPTPVLLASVLYISALHHPSSGLASLDSGYLAAIYSSIAELVTPSLHPSSLQEQKNEEHPQSKREKAFHDILGLIMASLSCEAYVDATGSWIAMAYRLWLDHCPVEMTSTTQDWRGLFSGLQVGTTTKSKDLNNLFTFVCFRLLISNTPQCICPIHSSHDMLQLQTYSGWTASREMPFRALLK
jgi:hypothetical protein